MLTTCQNHSSSDSSLKCLHCLLVDNLLAATGQLLIFTNSQEHDQIDQHLSCEGKANFLI